MYKLARTVLFLLPPEEAHYYSMDLLKLACSVGFKRKWITRFFSPSDQGVRKDFLGLHFKNPVGLGAGFDKNAKYLRELECLGFGFVEIGTVTPLPQEGNEKPRLFRLPKDKALINRMGFNNDGVKVIAKRLAAWVNKRQSQEKKGKRSSPRMIIGGNIGKNKMTPNEDAWKDYDICFRELHAFVDYFVVNVSSPNTPGLRELQEKESLRKILTQLQHLNVQLSGSNSQKPLLLKIAPDLNTEQVNDVIDLATEIKLDGLVVANTTISREQLVSSEKKLQMIGPGGLSGKPLRDRSTELVQYISQRTNGKLPVIASGGIFCGKDALQKMNAGAGLVQVWTGFIYEGPAIVKKICKHL